MEKPQAIIVVGPTASGKSALGLQIARRFGGEIVCCDSVQVYRGFDIGSAKPTLAERGAVPHHMFDLLQCHQDFSAGDYRQRALQVVKEINSRGKFPVIVGGTGLYLRALQGHRWDNELPDEPALRSRLAKMTNERAFKLLKRLDPRRAGEIHANDRYRILRALELRIITKESAEKRAAGQTQANSESFTSTTILLDPNRAILHERIAARTDEMLQNGFIEEVESLLKSGCSKDTKPMRSIGYLQVVQWLTDGGVKADLREKIIAATRQYAKRQVTWFKKSNVNLRVNDVSHGEILTKIASFLVSPNCNPKRI